MAGFWDKVKKGAQEAGEKAAQLAKITKIQTEITGLGSSRKEKILQLGEKVYKLYKEGKLGETAQEELKEFIAGTEDIEKKINDKKKEIEKIKEDANAKKEKMEKETKETEEKAKEKSEEIKANENDEENKKDVENVTEQSEETPPTKETDDKE